MNVMLDHIVHFIKAEPAAAAAKWRDHGYKAIPGGSHENWGTYNSLLYIGHTYLEFLSIENNQIASTADNPLIKQLTDELRLGEGIGQICFRTNNIEQLQGELAGKGFETHPIFKGSRRRADGSILSWKMLFLKENPDYKYPFFIDWGMEDDIRFEELRRLGLIDEKLAAKKIAAVYIASKDCEKSAAAWQEIIPASGAAVYISSDGKEKRASILIGSVNMIFSQPLYEDGRTMEVLRKRGEKPFAVQLAPSLEKEISLYEGLYF
jgi:Glyoxalase-like domain